MSLVRDTPSNWIGPSWKLVEKLFKVWRHHLVAMNEVPCNGQVQVVLSFQMSLGCLQGHTGKRERQFRYDMKDTQTNQPEALTKIPRDWERCHESRI